MHAGVVTTSLMDDRDTGISDPASGWRQNEIRHEAIVSAFSSHLDGGRSRAPVRYRQTGAIVADGRQRWGECFLGILHRAHRDSWDTYAASYKQLPLALYSLRTDMRSPEPIRSDVDEHRGLEVEIEGKLRRAPRCLWRGASVAVSANWITITAARPPDQYRYFFAHLRHAGVISRL